MTAVNNAAASHLFTHDDPDFEAAHAVFARHQGLLRLDTIIDVWNDTTWGRPWWGSGGSTRPSTSVAPCGWLTAFAS
jgi:hypothetical protein